LEKLTIPTVLALAVGRVVREPNSHRPLCGKIPIPNGRWLRFRAPWFRLRAAAYSAMRPPSLYMRAVRWRAAVTSLTQAEAITRFRL